MKVENVRGETIMDPPYMPNPGYSGVYIITPVCVVSSYIRGTHIVVEMYSKRTLYNAFRRTIKKQNQGENNNNNKRKCV